MFIDFENEARKYVMRWESPTSKAFDPISQEHFTFVKFLPRKSLNLSFNQKLIDFNSISEPFRYVKALPQQEECDHPFSWPEKANRLIFGST